VVALTAIVIGATGLVGRHLLQQLLEDPAYERVVTLGRRATGTRHDRLDEHVVDFSLPDRYADLVRGDVLYVAMGTTVAAAGSKEAQYLVDHTYPLEVARAARNNGVECCVLVSALGADPTSRMFYTRMKGELEHDLGKLEFPRSRILRPSFLEGQRSEPRTGERFALSVLRHLPSWGALDAWRPIHARDVARAARALARDPTPGVVVLSSGELLGLARGGEASGA
jgi:uncharacterized protein YbjT (DUF2867 family)